MDNDTGEYIVVVSPRGGPTAGIRTYGTFDSRAAFDEWYAKRMTDGTNRPVSEVYEIVEQGVSQERAVSSCDATFADACAYDERQFKRVLDTMEEQ